MRIARRNLAAAGAVSATSSETGYPASGLVDGDTTRPWVAAADAADVAIRVDLDAFRDAGGFEDWDGGVPVNEDGDEFGEDRSTGTGSTTEEGTLFNGGAAALKLTCTTGVRRRVFRVSEVSGLKARHGEVWTIEAYLRGDGTGAASIGIYDPITAKWWDPAGAGVWTATETYLASRTTASYAIATAAVTLDDFDAHQCEEVDLEIHLVCDDAGQVAYFDDLAAWPHWDLVVLHGHNVTPGLGVELRANDADSWADESAFQEDAFQADAFQQGSGELVDSITTPPRRPACYLLLDDVRVERYLEVQFPGTHPTRVYAGQVVVGQSESLVDPSFRPTHSGGAVLPQVVVAAGSRRYVHSYATDAPRELGLEFMARTFAEARELQQTLIWSTAQGRDLLAVIPIDDGPEVLLARVIEPLTESVRQVRDGHVHTFRLALAEDGFPTVSIVG